MGPWTVGYWYYILYASTVFIFVVLYLVYHILNAGQCVESSSIGRELAVGVHISHTVELNRCQLAVVVSMVVLA